MKPTTGKAEAEEAQPEAPPPDPSSAQKRATVRMLMLSLFQSVVQHVLVLQSEVMLFSQACGGDPGKTARALVNTTGITGVLGLVVNQVGGKLSDALGRKHFFHVGPLANIVCGLLVCLRPKSLGVLMFTRILKLMATTFSGSVMCQSSLMDVVSGKEMAVVGSQVNSWVGVAVVGSPFLESLLLKLGRNDPRTTYFALAVLAAAQSSLNSLAMPETLAVAKRASISKFFESVASINPFSFVSVYTSSNRILKKLVTIQTLQYFLEGKCTSELFQMWARNNLRWTNDNIRNFVAFWGAMVTGGGMFLHPYLLKTLSIRSYTSFTNICLWMGISLHGLAEKGACMWLGVPLLTPGVNGGSTHAVRSLANDIAVAEGYGNGEFTAWTNNLRALGTSMAAVLYGQWYARCQEKGVYAGSAWWIAAFLGGLLPQLILGTMPQSELEPPAAKAKG
mmetsp:Transcript_36128/g.114882  ORF Transcript_36128/g.114882 Transcript_36128/m.114882 type:complete len:450 (-) Transcript_36128:84-1433(-)